MKPSVIVTGANGNLGKSVVQKLNVSGYHIIAGVGPGGTDFKGIDAEAITVDLIDPAVSKKFVEQATGGRSPVKAAVLLVGGFAMGGIEQTDVASIRKMFSLNFETVYNIVQPLFSYFAKQKEGGQIILVGARPALSAEAGKDMVAYALSKSLVFKLSEFINEAGKGKNITSTVIVPSTIDTPANRQSMPDADFAKWVSPDAIADTIMFLLSDSGRQIREGVVKMYNNS